ncbi:MAG: phosphatidylglycerol lysyltransferase domain-containing protein [Roseiflexaceae bacterium]
MQYGANSMAYQILNPGMELWFSQHHDVVIGYVRAAGYVVVAGEPIGDITQLNQVVHEFSCAMQPTPICYFGAEHAFAQRITTTHSEMVWLGLQPWWQPETWIQRTQTKSSLRALRSVARRRGVHIRWLDEQTAFADLEACLLRWLEHRRMPPLHFVLESHTLAHVTDRHVCVAYHGDVVVGYVVASPIVLQRGWMIEQVVRSPDAPKGTTELLLDAMVHRLVSTGAASVTLGLAPLSQARDAPSRYAPWHIRMSMRVVRLFGQFFYNFVGLDRFKAKFLPERWDAIYAVTPGRAVSLWTLYAIAQAFCGVSPLVFLPWAMWHRSRQVLLRSISMSRRNRS